MMTFNQEQGAQFDSADHALRWSTEVLRARRFPKIASFYAKAEVGEVDHVLEFTGWRNDLPQEAEDKLALALQVTKVANGVLAEAAAQLLTWHYWGDFADEARYRKALKFQTEMRQLGKRVRLSYRYSFRQLGLLLGIGDKTAARRVRAALAEIEPELMAEGLVVALGQDEERKAA